MWGGSFIISLPIISGVIIAIIMRNIKLGIGTAFSAGAITLFVTSNTQEEWLYSIGAILCIFVGFACFFDIYRTEKSERDFKNRLGEYINTGQKIQRNKR